MAKIKFGALVVGARGKVGGTVFSRNKGGAYMKNKVTPLNPKTTMQQIQRQLLTSFAQAWRLLTQGERKGWISKAPDFPLKDIFGDTYFLAGNMLFNMLNLNLSKIGQPSINVAPAPVGTQSVILTELAPTALTMFVTLDIALVAGMSGLVRFTTGFSAGINNFNNKLRDTAVVTIVDGDSFDLFSAYEGLFGTPVAGTKIGCSFVVVNDTTGEVGTPTQIGAIVA